MRQSLPPDPDREEPLGALLPRLGHELRGPLLVIQGFVDLLLAEQAGPLTEEQRRYLEHARHSSERLARFVSELSAGAETATAPVRACDASLEALVESVASAVKPLLDRRRQRLAVRVAPGAARGWFDPARIEQVLHNLIANASEHGPDASRIDLAVECGTSSELAVSVTDDGPGMPDDGAARPGRGLGLEICRAIVAAHGGRFDVGRAPGRGAYIRFTLPRRAGSAS